MTDLTDGSALRRNGDVDPLAIDLFPAPTREAWLDGVAKVLKGADFERKLVGRTADGLRIEPIYERRADAVPVAPSRADGRWCAMQRVNHPDPREAASLALADLENGADGLVLVPAGARGARGFGLDLTDAATLDSALAGVMPELIALRIDPAPDSRRHAATLARVMQERRLDPAMLDVDFGIDPLAVLTQTGALPAPWPEVARRLAESVRSLSDMGFRGPFLTVDTREAHEAGASEAQELAHALGGGIAYLRALESQGIAPGSARGLISFIVAANVDQFLTTAKLRALRRLWAGIETACGLTPAPIRIHAETSWRMMTRRDPHVNMLRTTIAGLAAGLGGADTLTIMPFTAALGLPDAFARRVARNTQLVLIDEANLGRLVDPSAGAGGIEALTDGLCDAAWSLFQQDEALAAPDCPGYVAALLNGTARARIEAVARERLRAVATRRQPVTGVSEYPLLAEMPVRVVAPVPEASAPRPVRNGVTPDIVPWPSLRWAQDYETLRDRSDAALARDGQRPQVFLATLGPLAAFTARAGFARNLFEAGGFEAQLTDGYPDLDAMVAAWGASGAPVACLCGDDTSYETQGPAAAAALKAAGCAHVWLAGRPAPALEAALRAAGVENFIFMGCDVLAALESLWALMPEQAR
jgi:methylmalonyl-CoA mutase